MPLTEDLDIKLNIVFRIAQQTTNITLDSYWIS